MIVISYTQLEDAEARSYVPTVVHVDENNRVIELGTNPAEAIVEGVERPPHAVEGQTPSTSVSSAVAQPDSP